MKLAEIEVGQDYVVKEGSTPSAGSMSFSTLYRFHVTDVKQRWNGRRNTWRVVGYKCRKDGTPLYVAATGLPVESDFAPAMVLDMWG
jgi:hypothetical protein